MDWRSPREVLGFILRSTKRVVVLVLGLALVVAGLAMLVLPGPGVVVVILGLAVLASEFVWAERMLAVAKTQATKAKDKATSSWRNRRRSPDQGGV